MRCLEMPTRRAMSSVRVVAYSRSIVARISGVKGDLASVVSREFSEVKLPSFFQSELSGPRPIAAGVAPRTGPRPSPRCPGTAARGIRRAPASTWCGKTSQGRSPGPERRRCRDRASAQSPRPAARRTSRSQECEVVGRYSGRAVHTGLPPGSRQPLSRPSYRMRTSGCASSVRHAQGAQAFALARRVVERVGQFGSRIDDRVRRALLCGVELPEQLPGAGVVQLEAAGLLHHASGGNFSSASRRNSDCWSGGRPRPSSRIRSTSSRSEAFWMRSASLA